MKKILKSNKFKVIVILSSLFFLYIFICCYFYVCQISSDLSDNLFRLHIIANSDSVEDQNLKYIVRDNLISYMNSICEECTTKEETIEIVTQNIYQFEEIANNTISENGYDYEATVEIGEFKFPTKSYADITIPAGFYDALEVKIGKAEGQNWWCVLYPSLCFVDVTDGVVPDESKEELEENLNEEEYKLISEGNDTFINFKFKLIEIFTENNIITAKN